MLVRAQLQIIFGKRIYAYALGGAFSPFETSTRSAADVQNPFSPVVVFRKSKYDGIEGLVMPMREYPLLSDASAAKS
jgi:hypothetical protein